MHRGRDAYRNMSSLKYQNAMLSTIGTVVGTGSFLSFVTATTFRQGTIPITLVCS